MCGIAGVISWDVRHHVTVGTLRAMAGRLAHRGPDGEAVRLARPEPAAPRKCQAGFAFRRLAVLDCDERAMQPMSSADDRYTLVFNGEIYNYQDLRRRLPARHWNTTGDTEVLLAALAEWGPDVTLERLNGMFAFAFWDEQQQTLLLARDRMGQKPLYFTATDGSLAFASELGALAPWAHWDRTTDDDALLHYLRYGYVAAPRTIYRGVRQLEPGTRLLLGPGRAVPADLKRWFTMVRSEPAEPVPHKPAETRALIEQAVHRQLVSDVPLGVFLSGGIDSSIVAACARAAGPVKTFSIAFDDARYDETRYAEAVAKHLGTEHQAFRVTPDIADDLPKLAAVFGEPFGDSSALPTHWLSRQTRTAVTVALSGDAGDELFGGYDRYRAVAMRTRALRPLAAIGRRLERGHPKRRRTRVGRLLASSALPVAARYDRYVSLFDLPAADTLLGRDGLNDTFNEPRLPLFDRLLIATGGPTEAAMALDRLTYLPGDLLTKVDRCSMLHGLEVRSPFLDPDVLHLAAGLRGAQLTRGGPKRLLREAFAGALPPVVFKRKKMGFAVPISDWFRGQLRPLLHDTLSATDGYVRTRLAWPAVQALLADHNSGRSDHGQRLYALLMLELWHRARAA